MPADEHILMLRHTHTCVQLPRALTAAAAAAAKAAARARAAPGPTGCAGPSACTLPCSPSAFRWTLRDHGPPGTHRRTAPRGALQRTRPGVTHRERALCGLSAEAMALF